jgi:hypothetical protein
VEKIEETPAPSWLSPDQSAIWRAFEQAKVTCIKKNIDYGSSVFKSPRLQKALPPTSAVLVRMCDKIERLEHLLNLPDAERLVRGETTDDAIQDLGVYCFLYLIAKSREADSPPERRPGA